MDMRQAPRRGEVLAALRAQLPELHAEFGVKTLAVFGSVARDEAGPDSDVDVLVEFDRPIGFLEFIGLQDRLTATLGASVDLGTFDSLKPRIRARALSEAVYAA
jgi:uncharacterized protein